MSLRSQRVRHKYQAVQEQEGYDLQKTRRILVLFVNGRNRLDQIPFLFYIMNVVCECGLIAEVLFYLMV